MATLGNKITDPKKIAELEADYQDQKFSDDNSTFDSIVDFFSGTKKTEFADVPEIGEYVGPGAAAVGLGLSITPDMKAQAQIIQSQIPGSTITQDKFNNPIAIMPDGKSFYLNKPGASAQDVLQTTSQILMYIPGYSFVAKQGIKNILKRGGAQALAGGGTSVALDVAAKGLGAEDNVSLTRAGIAAGAGAAGELVIAPSAKFIGNVIKKFKRPEFVRYTADGNVVITPKGEAAIKAAGIDPAEMETVKAYLKQLQQGVEPSAAKIGVEGTEFGIELNKAQAAGDGTAVSKLYEASKNTYGPEFGQKARDFLKNQNYQVEVGYKNLLNQFNKGILDVEDLNIINQQMPATTAEAGQNIVQSVQQGFQKASDKYKTAYDLVDADAIFRGGKSNIQVLPNSVGKALLESGTPLDKTLTPATMQAVKSIDDFVARVSKSDTELAVNPVILRTFETERKKLGAIINAATNQTDKRGATLVKNEFDKMYDDALDNVLFGSGNNPKAIQAIKTAREAYKEKQKLYGINPKTVNGLKIQDNAGRLVAKILDDESITPLKAIDGIFGAGKIGGLKDSLQIVRRLKKIFGVDEINQGALLNNDFQSLRTAMMERVFDNSIVAGKLVPDKLVRQFDEIFKKNPEIINELFTKAEVANLKKFVETVRKTLNPKELANMSNTASVVSEAFSGLARQGFGLAGFKIGNIQGLLAARSLFDRAKDISQRRAAKKLIEENFGPTGSVFEGVLSQQTRPVARARDVGAVQTFTGQSPVGGIEAPLVPPEVIYQSPNLDRPSLFRGLFPGDPLGATITERKK